MQFLEHLKIVENSFSEGDLHSNWFQMLAAE